MVLPLPDSPMIATNSPCSTLKLTSRNASTRLLPRRVVYVFSDVLLPELPFIFLSFLYCVFQNPLFPVSLSKSVGSVPIYRLIIAIHSSGCLNLCLQKYRKPYIRVRFPVAFSFYRARACLKRLFVSCES